MIEEEELIHSDDDQDSLVDFVTLSHPTYPAREKDATQELPEEEQEIHDLTEEYQETSSFFYDLLRDWHYTHFITRFALWRIRQPLLDISTSSLEPPPASTRLCWLHGEGIPLEALSKSLYAHFVKDFLDSVHFMIMRIMPSALTGVVLHDLISYGLFPKKYCEDSLISILDGTMHSQIAWGRHLGSDVFHEASYWNGFIFASLPLIFGLLNAGIQAQQRKKLCHFGKQQVLNQLTILLRILDKETFSFKKALSSLWPCSSVSTALERIKYMVLWDGRRDEDKNLLVSIHIKEAFIANLIELTHSTNYFLIRYQALRLLAQIAASFHPKNVAQFIHDPTQQAELIQLRRFILTALKTEPSSEAQTRQNLIEIESMCIEEQSEPPIFLDDPPRGGFARYFLWTLGEERHPLTQLFWIPFILSSVYQTYFLIRYIELVLMKAMDLFDYFEEKTLCEKKGYFFKFLSQNEQYHCVACDWPFISYQSYFTSQACLHNLLQQKINPQTLSIYINQLPQKQEIIEVDLSYQNWSSWSAEEWEHLLLSLQPRLVSPLQQLNISAIISDDIFVQASSPTQAQIESLARWLISIQVIQFDLRNQQLTDEQFNLLLPSLAHEKLTALYLINTNFTDQSALFLSEIWLKHVSNLTNLQLADNLLSDVGLAHLSQALSHRSLQIMNVANNQFSDSGLQKLAEGIQPSVLHTLDISGHTFSAQSLRYFSETLKKSSLKTLTLHDGHLESEDLVSLQDCLKNLIYLDLSDNLLIDKDIPFLFKQLSASALKTLILARNEFTDQAAHRIAEGLPTTRLQNFDFSGHALSEEGFTDLVSTFPQSHLLSFSCELCQLNDRKIAQLTEIFANSSLILQSLNLNKNQITEHAFVNWLKLLPKTNLTTLSLNNNAIRSIKQSAPFAQALRQTSLTTLDLSENALDTEFFNELATVLPQTKLQKLNLSHNKLKKIGLEKLAEALVDIPCYREELNKTTLSRQMKRVLYPMKANTALTQLNVVNTELDPSTLTSLCRVASSLSNIHFLPAEQAPQMNWRTCKIMPSAPQPLTKMMTFPVNQSESFKEKVNSSLSLSPLFISLLCSGGFLLLIGLLYSAYRVGRSTQRFFRPASATQLFSSISNESSATFITDATQRPSSP
jgi:Ran GTPase-activating protein (RanGAP) involved in mRNA processing and transport